MKKRNKQTNKNKDNNKVICFVYGTLMRNNRNNYFLGGAKYLCDATIPRHICFDLPYGFPMVIDTGVEIDNYVLGELWEVDVKDIPRMDMLEGYDEIADDGMYLRREIIAMDTNGKEYKAYYYVWNKEIVEGSFIVPTATKWSQDGIY